MILWCDRRICIPKNQFRAPRSSILKFSVSIDLTSLTASWVAPATTISSTHTNTQENVPSSSFRTNRQQSLRLRLNPSLRSRLVSASYQFFAACLFIYLFNFANKHLQGEHTKTYMDNWQETRYSFCH